MLVQRDRPAEGDRLSYDFFSMFNKTATAMTQNCFMNKHKTVDRSVQMYTFIIAVQCIQLI